MRPSREVDRRLRSEMEPSQLGLVVGNMACRARANAWNHHRCRCRLFTMASCHSALRIRCELPAEAGGADLGEGAWSVARSVGHV